MAAIRALVWAGAAGWLFIALDFGVSFFLRLLGRQSGARLRLTWALAAFGASAFLGSRLQPLPYQLRVFLDLFLAVAGALLGVAMLVTLAQRGLGVLK